MDSKENKGMGRREFIGAAAAALFAGVTITLVGCSEDDSPTTPTGGDKGATVQSVNGHSHSAIITKAQMDAGGAVTLTLTQNGHEHTVDFTADDVANIKKGGVHVEKTSSSVNSHAHGVMFM